MKRFGRAIVATLLLCVVWGHAQQGSSSGKSTISTFQETKDYQVGDKSQFGQGECVDFVRHLRPDLDGKVSYNSAREMTKPLKAAGFRINDQPTVGSVLLLPNAAPDARCPEGICGHVAIVQRVTRQDDGKYLLRIVDANFDVAKTIGQADYLYNPNNRSIEKMDYACDGCGGKKVIDSAGRNTYSEVQFIDENEAIISKFQETRGRPPTTDELTQLSRTAIEETVEQQRRAISPPREEVPAQILPSQKVEGAKQQVQLELLREEARREHGEDQRVEYRSDQLRQLDRQSEYQLSKSAIDIHGNRVRIDSYIRRPNPTQVEHWVLNFRESRFDYGYIRRTFAQALGSLSEIGPMDLFISFGSAVLPSNYLVKREDVVSNNQDQFFWNNLYGAPTLTNTLGRALYIPRSIDSTLRIQGQGYDVTKWRLTEIEEFDLNDDLNFYTYTLRYPNAAGVLDTYATGVINRNTGNCIASCLVNLTIAPTLAGSATTSQTIRFKDNTWLANENWALKDNGTQVPWLSLLRQDGSIVDDVNIERTFRASEMQGRDIDFIFPGKFLIPDGSLPSAPSTP